MNAGTEMNTTTKIGLGTYRALVATFEPCRAWVREAEFEAWERQLFAARIRLIDSATVTKWKARLVFPADVRDRELLAEDLRAWAFGAGLIDEFETTHPKRDVRQAFARIADELTAGIVESLAA